ncbi:MAG: GntR family transcriptional regulator [Clostridia bacterium]
MSIELNRKSGVPLYVQIKQYITAQIEEDIWHPGSKLPTERELANMLNVSRSTVSVAYKELEDENTLISKQGKGTFVAEQTLTEQKEKLNKLLEKFIVEAIEQGYNSKDISKMVGKVAKEKIKQYSNVHILFIECNKEQVDFFSTELSNESGILVKPLVLAEIYKDKDKFYNLAINYDLIVTTFFHYDEVVKLLRELKIDKDVIAISLEPKLETMIKIAKFNQSKDVGLICISENFAKKVENSIKSSGIKLDKFSFTNTREIDALNEFIISKDYLLTSPGRKKEVEQLASENTEIIEFVYRPDVGSINMLNNAVLNYQKSLVRRE